MFQELAEYLCERNNGNLHRTDYPSYKRGLCLVKTIPWEFYLYPGIDGRDVEI